MKNTQGNTTVKTRKNQPAKVAKKVEGDFAVRWDDSDKVDARFKTVSDYQNYVKGNQSSHKSVIITEEKSGEVVGKGAW